MRSYGEIEGVGFRRIGFDIYTNGIKYKLIGYNENIMVSVNTMTELKEEIRKLNQEPFNHE